MKTERVSISFQLKTAVPVHLGCGEAYEPMGFAMDEAGGRMIVFAPRDFVASLPRNDKAAFSAICKQGTVLSLIKIYRFIRERSRLAVGRSIAVPPALLKHYGKTLSINKEAEALRELNRFNIERTAYRASDHAPHIPGSAVKGALRTGYLNGLDKMKNLRPRKGRSAARDMENHLLSSRKIENDPFRLVRVSDFIPQGPVRSRIVYAVNEKKTESKFHARGPYQILEVIEPGAVFTGEITVEPPLRGAPVKEAVDHEKLFRMAEAFFKNEKDREDEELARIGIQGSPRLNGKGGTIPIRIGRHSGAESVTVERHRDIKIMKGWRERPDYRNHATTLWLAADKPGDYVKRMLRPFGWAELCPEKTNIE